MHALSIRAQARRSISHSTNSFSYKHLLSTYYKTEGLVLKKTPYGEADFLVRIFAHSFGKIDVIAKGARKSVSKLNAHLDALNAIRFSFVKNGERLPTLTDAEVLDRFDAWFCDAGALAFAQRIAKTLDMLAAPDQENDDLLRKTIMFLQRTPSAALERDAEMFLRDILAHEGFGSDADVNTLPHQLANGIMKLWPTLMN